MNIEHYFVKKNLADLPKNLIHEKLDWFCQIELICPNRQGKLNTPSWCYMNLNPEYLWNKSLFVEYPPKDLQSGGDFLFTVFFKDYHILSLSF